MVVQGRHIGKLKGYPEYIVMLRGNTIRVDDAKHPDFWLEITLTPEEKERFMNGETVQFVMQDETNKVVNVD